MNRTRGAMAEIEAVDEVTPTSLFDELGRVLPHARPHSVRLLADTARLKSRLPDQTFFRQGEPIPLTMMVRGHAAIRRTTADGRELVLGIARPGFLFGYSSIAGSPAGVDLVAVTPARVAIWPGDEVRALVVDDAGLALDVIEGMARNVVQLSERLDGFIHQQARRRVLRVLAEYQDLFFGEPSVLSRGHLPGLVGTSREMTGRVVRELEREGILARVGRRGLRLLSPAGLAFATALRSA
jgi:CRP/FNR family transcriptional regulator